MKKKVISALLATAMIASMMVGCGNNSAETTAATKATEAATAAATEAATTEAATTEATTTEAAETVATESEAASAAASTVADLGNLEGKKIGICIYKFDDNFMTLYRQYLEQSLKDAGAEVTMMDGKNDQSEQVNQIDNFITQGVDALILNLVQSSAAEQIADKCAAANIPTVFINREPEKTEQQRWADEGIQAAYVGADASQSGTFQGEMILETANGGDINGDGKIGYIMVQGDPENIDAQQRTEFSIKALTDAGVEVDELDIQRGDWDQTKGQEITANALTANGDAVEVVFCNNDAMALGAAQAISAAGRTVGKDIYLVGVDALTDALEKIVAGEMTGTVFNDHMSQANKAAEVVNMMLGGEKTDVYYGVDYVKVTQDNAQDVLDILK